MEIEIQSAPTDHLPQCFEARVNLPSFPASDNGLGFFDPRSELDLRQACAQSGLPDQIATHHSSIIVQMCYIRFGAERDSRNALRFASGQAISGGPNKGVAARLTPLQPVLTRPSSCGSHLQLCDSVRRSRTRRNALTRTFNPKVPGSRPGRPTRSTRGVLVPDTTITPALQMMPILPADRTPCGRGVSCSGLGSRGQDALAGKSETPEWFGHRAHRFRGIKVDLPPIQMIGPSAGDLSEIELGQGCSEATMDALPETQDSRAPTAPGGRRVQVVTIGSSIHSGFSVTSRCSR
jgi:hypothetical protein